MRPLLAVVLLALTSPVQADSTDNDPYAYGLRIALLPASFQAGIHQSHFGSSVRGEADLGRGLGVQLSGKLGWLNVGGEKDHLSFAGRGGFIWHFIDHESVEPLSGNVYAADVPASANDPYVTDVQLGSPDRSRSDTPLAQRMGGPRMSNPDYVEDLRATMRHVMSIRLGYELARSVQTPRPIPLDEDPLMLNTGHGIYTGFGWGTHWNLEPNRTGGSREVGWKRYYVDLTLTAKPLVTRERLRGTDQPKLDFFPLGLRLGLDGAMAGFWKDAAGVGFAYNLEVGALGGYSGLEAYLLIGLGLELDALTVSP